MGTKLKHCVGRTEHGQFVARGAGMSIEALMTAVDAAGYVMVAEEDLPEAFGDKALKEQSTALTVWEPVLAAAAGKPGWTTPLHNAWGWVTRRPASGAAA